MELESEERCLKEKALSIFHLLDKNYPEEISFLKYRNNFELLICVILSAQTTDRQVMQVAGPLFEKYPDANSLADGDIKQIMDIVKPVGFFRVKASNIKKTASLLLQDYGGVVPDTIEKLVRLPGVGRKSANVLLGALFGKPSVIVDTHFSRVVRRLGLTEQKDPWKIENDILKIVEDKSQYRFSMAVNFHGRQICHSRKPQCGRCFLNHLCDRVIM